MPYEKQQEMLWELEQIDIGLGTLAATNERIQQAMEHYDSNPETSDYWEPK
jgi:transposase